MLRELRVVDLSCRNERRQVRRLAEGAAPNPGELVSPAAEKTAAEKAHLGALRTQRRAGYVFEPRVLAEGAAAGGQVAVLEWVLDELRLRDEPGALTPAMFTAAAKTGNVECMRWLVAHGCGLQGAEGAWAAAVESGCEAAVELLAELGCPRPAGGEPYLAAVQERYWHLPPLLSRLGVPAGPHGQLVSTVQIQQGRRLAAIKALERKLATHKPADLAEVTRRTAHSLRIGS
ncbi:hypothetical protein HYH03_010529 [Edaphochlamys debaryana]|uniref:Ankyrin repeat domain-containing protein n=1 Tax=Edaphochlamys debaryana TaxID=47281 RepID=A0A835XWE7_9CHLO|nr:hypothetical protein HYH03_010529 [Edaphochlamys debaryana]|eukprot:KAG2491085.1 hypothetical protein HYH03_010529 [Edaphochlamys debaryana]